MASTPRPLGSSYQLLTFLGSGSFGEVWRGTDASGHDVAIKVLRADVARDVSIVERFIREKAALGSIQHPHVVRVRDLVIEGPTLAIVMDLVPGKSLREALRHYGTLPPAVVAQLTGQLAGALAASHQRQIVHRDVKPENVLLDAGTNPPEPRLTDFGVAKILSDASQSTVLAGTPQYLAPELVRGEATTGAADVYALGVLAYEMFCGLTPFADRTTIAGTLNAHTSLLPGRPEGIPDPLWAVISAALAKDPAARPSAAAVAERLAPLVTSLAQLPAAPRCHVPPQGTPIAAGTVAASVVGSASSPGQTPIPPVQVADATVLAVPTPHPTPSYGTPTNLANQVQYVGTPVQGYPPQGYATPAPITLAYQPPPDRSRTLIAALVGALVVAVLIVGGWLLLGKREATSASGVNSNTSQSGTSQSGTSQSNTGSQSGATGQARQTSGVVATQTATTTATQTMTATTTVAGPAQPAQLIDQQAGNGSSSHAVRVVGASPAAAGTQTVLWVAAITSSGNPSRAHVFPYAIVPAGQSQTVTVDVGGGSGDIGHSFAIEACQVSGSALSAVNDYLSTIHTKTSRATYLSNYGIDVSGTSSDVSCPASSRLTVTRTS